MQSIHRHRWFLPAIAMLGVLGLWQAVIAQTKAIPGAGQPPFASAVDQRNEMIAELKAIRAIMKEQAGLIKELVDAQHGAAKPKR
jgi:hypothetical protein